MDWKYLGTHVLLDLTKAGCVIHGLVKTCLSTVFLLPIAGQHVLRTWTISLAVPDCLKDSKINDGFHAPFPNWDVGPMAGRTRNRQRSTD